MKNDDKYKYLKKVIDSYYPISADTWARLQVNLSCIDIKKNESISKINETPNSFYFVTKGLLRVFINDEKGTEYNKTFFNEGTFPGTMVSLLKNKPSEFEIQALENCELIQINFKKYRELLEKSSDLKMFHICYLERNWLIKMESKDVSFVQKDAQERYEDFLENYPDLESRLPQYHIASHLGITPTQLSRIRKKN